MNTIEGDNVSTFTEVGVSYCVQHHGVANEDDEVCDFKRIDARDWNAPPESRFPCQFQTLGYMKPKRKRAAA